MLKPHRRDLLLGTAGAALSWPGLARAQGSLAADWPTRPVRLVVPFAPGGPTDVYGRLLAEHLTHVFGQPFVVENRAGGTGAVGTTAVARAPADGHTLMFTSISGFTLPVLLLRQPGFDPQQDFTPISLTIRYPFYLVAHPRFGSVAALVEAARAAPGRLNYGSPGQGSAGHLCTERFRLRAGIEAVHVPYSGAAPALLGLVGGQVQFCFDSVGNAQTTVREGRITGLAVTGGQRAPAVPEVPTLVEAGFPGFDADLWLGLLGPQGMPAPIVQALNRACDAFLALPAVRERLHQAAYDPAGGPPDLFVRRIREDVREWGEVVRQAGLAPG